MKDMSTVFIIASLPQSAKNSQNCLSALELAATSELKGSGILERKTGMLNTQVAYTDQCVVLCLSALPSRNIKCIFFRWNYLI